MEENTTLRSVGFGIGLLIAVVLAFKTSILLGVVLALTCFVFQAMVGYGRSADFCSTTKALIFVAVRVALFLVPLLLAFLTAGWYSVVAVAVAWIVTLLTFGLS